MNTNREHVLKKLRNLISDAHANDDLYDVIKQALGLRPVPFELMRDVVGRRGGLQERLADAELRKGFEQKSYTIMTRLAQPSERAENSDHPVGKVLRAIRAALPEFQHYSVNVPKAAQSLVGRLAGEWNSADLPQPIAQGASGAYLYASRGALFRRDDGSFCTLYELVEEKETAKGCDESLKEDGYISDVVTLVWTQPESITLHDVEQQLNRLQEVIAPDAPVRFVNQTDPRYRSALRMQLGDNPFLAAIGGVLNPRPNMPEGVIAAQAQLFLESWATAQSGKSIAPVRLAQLLQMVAND